MLALAWQWADSGRNKTLSRRLGSSLCAGIGGHAGTADVDGLHFAYRPLRSTTAASRAWRPALLPNETIVVFHGFFDNAPAIAAELGTDVRDHAGLYGLSVERWGDEADRWIIGDYCAAIADPRHARLRLSRSPLRAPPLYYFHGDRLTAAASVPRALFAAGVEQRLNEVRVADSAMLNFADVEASWFEDVAQVPTGSVVELERNRPRVLRQWYDVLDIPDQHVTSDADAVARAGALLEEGVRACLVGFDRPGATLSGGLDSPQVAVRALAALAPGQKLPTFTFHPEEAFDGLAPQWMMGDERPLVKAFAAMHPGIEPHFTANEGYGHDHRWNDMFHLIGGPSHLNTMYVFHGLLSEAVKTRCDVLLLAEWGNLTFSDTGDSGFVEYLVKGRWRQLWLALKQLPKGSGSMPRRFVARSLSGLLPDSLWRPLRRMFLPRHTSLAELVRPLSAEYRRSSGADRRLEDSGIIADRYQPWSRRHARKLLFGGHDAIAETHQGFEQMYGITLRDPTAYRPFAEYCLGLPTRMFLRDGERRWLARQMSRGIMPEAQRTNPLTGWWDADWHLRIGRRRKEYLAELDRLEQDERFGRMFDVPRLRAALEDWPDQTETDPQKSLGRQLAVPAALLAARFIAYVEGSNAG